MQQRRRRAADPPADDPPREAATSPTPAALATEATGGPDASTTAPPESPAAHRPTPPATYRPEPPAAYRPESSAAYRLDASAGHLLRRAHQRYQTTFLDAAAGLGLTGPQFALLLRLAETGRATQNHLGRLAAMDSATAQGVVRRLCARNLLRATGDPLDRRTRILTLTEEGNALLAAAQQAGRRANEALLAPLDPTERAHLLALLRRLTG